MKLFNVTSNRGVTDGAFDQIPNEKKTAAFCAAAAAWKAAVRQLRCHGSVGNRSEQP